MLKRPENAPFINFALGCCLLLLLSFHLQATEKKTLQFVTDNFPTLVEELGPGRVCGIGPYLARIVTESIGYRFSLDIAPLPRALKIVERGMKDGVLNLYKTEEREKYLQFVPTPYFTDAITLYHLKNIPIPWQGSIESLKPHRIGLMQGWYYTERFKKLETDPPGFRFDWIPQRESGFRMLLARRIDVLISNQRNYQEFMKNQGARTPGQAGPEKDILALHPLLEYQGVYMALSKNLPPSLVREFDAALARLLKDPKIQRKLQSSEVPCPP